MSVQTERNPLRCVLFLAVAFFAGLAVRGLIDSSSPSSRDTSSEASVAHGPEATGPSEHRGGVPAGFAHTREGARAAAAAYVLTGQVLLSLPPTQLDDAIRTMASSGSADEQIADADARVGRLREVLAEGTGPVRYVQSVLATRVDAYTPSRARVSAWSVGVLSRENVAAPQAGWSVSTFELVWERGDWKIWNETIADGPAPMLNAAAEPATSEELDQALRGFTPWRPL